MEGNLYEKKKTCKRICEKKPDFWESLYPIFEKKLQNYYGDKICKNNCWDKIHDLFYALKRTILNKEIFKWF